jgi:hypothetical protein
MTEMGAEEEADQEKIEIGEETITDGAEGHPLIKNEELQIIAKINNTKASFLVVREINSKFYTNLDY